MEPKIGFFKAMVPFFEKNHLEIPLQHFKPLKEVSHQKDTETTLLQTSLRFFGSSQEAGYLRALAPV